MRIFFCINENGLVASKAHYEAHLRVTITSCLLNTKLKPTLIYAGDDNNILRSIENAGVDVIRHKLSFHQQLKDVCSENNVNFGVAEGAFLRIDIPDLTEDEFVIYTDADVMFQRHPHLESVRPDYFSATSEVGFEHYGHPNSGVMVMNVKAMRAEKDEFIRRIVEGKMKTSLGDPYDQGHLTDHYKGRWNVLDQSFNWKPYWGLNEYAPIVHWHGVKFPAALANMAPAYFSYEPSRMHTKLFERAPDAYAWYIRKFSEILSKSVF